MVKIAQTLFNLIDEPWIPVFRPGHATPHAELGIRDVIAQAREIRCLADSSPIVNLALLRFLVALLHSAGVVKGDDPDTWTQKTEAYLDQWHDRFWLYHPKWPFMQDAGKASKKADKAIASLLHHYTQDTNIAHFAHCSDGGFGLSLQECARGLLVQTVAPTNSGRGFKACINGVPPVYLVPRPINLETLLRLHLPDRQRTSGDVPSWEGQCTATGRVGLLEGLTLQPRSMLLGPTDSDGIVTSMVYDAGADVDAIVAPTKPAKTTPSRKWSDPHALPLKHPNPLSGFAESTLFMRLLHGLTEYTPWALKSELDTGDDVMAEAIWVSHDSKAKFYSVASASLCIPATFLSGLDAWIPLKKDYKFRLGSTFGSTYEIERLPGVEALRVGSEIVRAVFSQPSRDLTGMDRKARLAFENSRREALLSALHEAIRGPSAGRTIDNIKRQLRSVSDNDDRTRTSTYVPFIQALTNPELFGPTVLHSLRTAISTSEDDLIALTDHLNDELRQKKLISGTDRRWGWLVAKLYAHHPFHATNDASMFGRRLNLIATRGSKAHYKRLEAEILGLATCPLDEVGNHLVKLVNWIGAHAAKSGVPCPIDYQSLLNDLCELPHDRFRVASRWYRAATFRAASRT